MTPPVVSHVMWDWNGTLLDDTETCVAALNGILQPRGLGPVSCDQYREVFSFPVQDYYIRLGFDFAKYDWNDIAEEYHRLYTDLSVTTPLREGALAVLEEVQGRGIDMSILSASNQTFLEAQVASRGIRRFFVDLYGLPDLFARSKAAVASDAIARIRTPDGAVLIVGDTTHDAEVAHALGCSCLLVCGGHQAKHRLRSCDCPVVESIHDVVAFLDQAE